MLLRSQIPKTSATSVRLLHTTRSNLGFMDWFSFKKSEEAKKKKNIEKPKDIDEVIKDVESDKVELKKVDNIEFIGTKYRKGLKKGQFDLKTEEQIQAKIEELGYNVWLNDKKVQTLDELKQAVVESYNEVTGTDSPLDTFKFEEIDLNDLQFRFDVTFKIQEKCGFIIPDNALTSFSNLQELLTYVDYSILGNKTYSEKILEKKTLDIKDLKFQAPNISIQEPVNSKQRKETYDKLLQSAKAEQESKTKKLIEDTRA